MSEYSNETLTELLKNLDKKIDEGFIGVHKRQDTTNGKVLGNRSWIDENRQLIKDLKEDRENKFKKYSDTLWKIAQAIIFIALGVKIF